MVMDVGQCLRPWGARFLWGLLLLGAGFGGGGCTRFEPGEVSRLSRGNMGFGGSGAWVATSRLTLQIESGRAGQNGAQAAGCSTCR
jgi:hypothetical protein